jgi:alpha-mannosidase
LDSQPVDARVEMVAGTLSQPYGGPCVEEQYPAVVARTKLIRKHFPNALPVTYAVQEPCWASCLPQILVSLGYTGACLKDPGTAWGGYSAGFDAEVVNWVGPDGSRIPAVRELRL